MFSFTTQMQKSIEALETSPFAAPGDATVASWARLHHIIDLSDAALGLRGDKVNFSDEAVQLSLLNCTKQLESWKERTPTSIANGMPFFPRIPSPLIHILPNKNNRPATPHAVPFYALSAPPVLSLHRVQSCGF